MKRFRRILVAVVALLVAVVATACSNKSNSSKGGYTPKSLTIQFVPSQAATKLQARAKPLEKMLSKRLGIPVHVSMSTDYNTVVEAMKSKKVDVGFLPPDGYVLAHKQGAADLLLQAERYGVKQPGGKATNQLVKSYRAEILVKKGSKIKNWKEVGGADMKIVAYSRETSSGTYEFFKESVLKNKNYMNGILSMPATGAIIQSVSQTKGAIGYVGLAYINKEVKPIHVSYDAGKTFTEPSFENAKNKAYPIVRPLFYYYDVKNEGKVKPFIDYILSAEGQATVKQVGYIPVK